MKIEREQLSLVQKNLRVLKKMVITVAASATFMLSPAAAALIYSLCLASQVNAGSGLTSTWTKSRGYTEVAPSAIQNARGPRPAAPARKMGRISILPIKKSCAG